MVRNFSIGDDLLDENDGKFVLNHQNSQLLHEDIRSKRRENLQKARGFCVGSRTLSLQFHMLVEYLGTRGAKTCAVVKNNSHKKERSRYEFG